MVDTNDKRTASINVRLTQEERSMVNQLAGKFCELKAFEGFSGRIPLADVLRWCIRLGYNKVFPEQQSDG